MFINRPVIFPMYKTVTIDGLNIYDLLVYETLVVTKDALAGIEEALLNEEPA